MLGTSTPFKIHDENAGEGSLTGSKLKGGGGSVLKKGLGGVSTGFKDAGSVHKMPKKGLGGSTTTYTTDVSKTPLAPKSVRKALGELSATHVNTQHRTMTGGLGLNPLGGTEKKLAAPPSMTKCAVSFQMASEAITIAANNSSNIDAADMICSQVRSDVDVYDSVMHEVQRKDVMVILSTGVCDAENSFNFNQEEQDQEHDWSNTFAPGDYMSDYGADEAFPTFTLSLPLPAEEEEGID